MVHIIGWWTDIESFINGNVCILKCITDIENTCSDSMHICDSNVDSEWVRMCHWNVGLIKINTFNMITPIFTVACNKFPCIRTVTFLNTRSNEWAEAFCFIREGFDWDRIRKNSDMFLEVWHLYCCIAQIKILSGIFSEDLLNFQQCSLVR